MPSYWILKTEPTTYSYGDLAREKSTTWGDQALIYHSGKEKAVVGLARITSGPYGDPEQDDPKLVVVDLAAAERLPRPVELKTIKADPAFKDLALVRMGRLSVMPATAAQWRRLLKLAGR
jgi:predicted RNA-binding protein with PUA-like domain